MKTKHLIASLIFGMFFVACKQEKKEQPQEKTQEETPVSKPSLKEYMVGNWETNYIKIEYQTYKSTDSTSVFEDDFSKPNAGKAQSTYKNDGTFTAWFLKANGEKVGETTGNWQTKNDSLYVDYPYLGKQIQAWYHIEQTNEGFDGKVIYDWDDDGNFDDTLFMKSKRLE